MCVICLKFLRELQSWAGIWTQARLTQVQPSFHLKENKPNKNSWLLAPIPGELAWQTGRCDSKANSAVMLGYLWAQTYSIKPALHVLNAHSLLWITVIVWLALPLCCFQLAAHRSCDTWHSRWIHMFQDGSIHLNNLLFLINSWTVPSQVLFTS